jgi:hypothetical protein
VSASRLSIVCDGGTGSQVIADPRDNPFPDALYPAGVGGIRLEQVGGLRRNPHISVEGLTMAVLPAMVPARTVAALFASRGGKSTSSAKRRSARANGRKGARPSKAAPIAGPG